MNMSWPSARPRWSRRSSGALFAILALGVGPAVSAGSAGAAVAGSSRFVPVEPKRILDTRTDNAVAPEAPKGYVNAGSTITLQVGGRNGIPSTATAAVLNITATASGGAGFVTVWPHGQPRPEASTLNVERVGQTIPNLSVVQLGTDASVDLFVQSGADLIADVSGYFEPAASSAAGRLIPTRPTRVVDTRDGTGVRPGLLNAGETLLTSVGTSVGPGYEAAVLNVTATDSAAAGFVSVWPGGAGRPNVSNLNVETAAQTIPNLVIVPLGPSGTINFYAQSGTHIIADLLGLFTDGTAPSTAEGLFVPQAPDRIGDSRVGKGFATLGRGGSATLQVSSASDVGAMLANVTATKAQGRGFITVWPGDQGQPASSNLNIDRAGQTIPNLVISGVSAQKSINLFAQSGTDLIVDLAGVFTKSTSITPTPPPTQGDPGSGTRDRFKIFYTYPTDSVAPDLTAQITLQAQLKHHIALTQDWVKTQADNRVFRLSGVNNIPDVYIYNDGFTKSQQTANALYTGALASGLLQPNEYAFFFVKDMPGCGEDALPRRAGFIAICPQSQLSSSAVWPDGQSAQIGEVMVQALGAVPSCAPHFDGTHYLTSAASHRDLMYEGPGKIFDANLELDKAHTEYYGHNRAGCYDLKLDTIWTTP